MCNQSLGSNSGSRVGVRTRNLNRELWSRDDAQNWGLGSNSRSLFCDTGVYSPISD